LAGTDRYFVTDSSGRFTLRAAAGAYRLLFSAADGHFLPASGPVTVPAGDTAYLPSVNLEWNPLAEPPVPAGLYAAPDSDLYVIRLGWKPVWLANLSHYELQRRDTLDAGNNRTFAVTDTLFTDSVQALPEGRVLQYRVRAVNTLGLGVFGAPLAGAVPGPFSWTLQGMILEDGIPALAYLRLFRAPAAPGSPDSFPLPLVPVDSGYNNGATGRFAMGPYVGGPYTLEAIGFGAKALRQGMGIHRRGTVAESLSLRLTGELRGSASRGPSGLGDVDIQVSLAGTPYATLTQADGSFILADVAPGSYKAVFYAPPEGIYWPETLSVAVNPAGITGLSRVDLRRIFP
jgi:hypothetical protein